MRLLQLAKLLLIPGTIKHYVLIAIVFLANTILVNVAFAEPSVSGNVISWPDDGWYQVQSADDYTSLCEGGRSCTVSDGTYIVINHTTGQRHEGVQVPDPTTPPNDSTLVSTWLAGISEVINHNPHARWFPVLRTFETAADSGSVPPGVTLVNSERDTRGNQIVIRFDFSCDAGGTFVRYRHFARFGRNEVLFNNCQLPEQTIDGALFIGGSDIGGYFASYDSLVIQAGTSEYQIDGVVRRTVGRAINFRTDEIGPLNYTHRDNGDEVRVTGLQQVTSDDLMTSPRTHFNTGFQVSAPWTAGQTVHITTLQEFADADAGDGNYAVGRLQARSDDGVSLDIDADTGERSSFQTALSRDGSVTSTIEQWGDDLELPCVSVPREEQAIGACDFR
jgi:hypothetical protein